MVVARHEIREKLRAIPARIWIAIETVCLLGAVVGAVLAGAAVASYLASIGQPTSWPGPWPRVPDQIVAQYELGNRLLSAGLILAAITSAGSVWGLRMPWLALRILLGPITTIAIVVAEFPMLRLVFMTLAAACGAPGPAAPDCIPPMPAGLNDDASSGVALRGFLVAWLVTTLITIALALRSRLMARSLRMEPA